MLCNKYGSGAEALHKKQRRPEMAALNGKGVGNYD